MQDVLPAGLRLLALEGPGHTAGPCRPLPTGFQSALLSPTRGLCPGPRPRKHWDLCRTPAFPWVLEFGGCWQSRLWDQPTGLTLGKESPTALQGRDQPHGLQPFSLQACPSGAGERRKPARRGLRTLLVCFPLLSLVCVLVQ